jgi:hypothetical protein
MACHFVTALKVPGIGRTKAKIHASSLAQQELDEFDESFDIDISMDTEASPDDVKAMHAMLDVTFEVGDVVGKLLAFIAQLRACSEDMREYLAQIASSLGGLSWEIKLWVRTRWGSLSDCFRTVLAIQKVCSIVFFYDLCDNFRCYRLLIASVALLMMRMTCHPLLMARNGPTTCFLD